MLQQIQERDIEVRDDDRPNRRRSISSKRSNISSCKRRRSITYAVCKARVTIAVMIMVVVVVMVGARVS